MKGTVCIWNNHLSAALMITVMLVSVVCDSKPACVYLLPPFQKLDPEDTLLVIVDGRPQKNKEGNAIRVKDMGETICRNRIHLKGYTFSRVLFRVREWTRCLLENILVVMTVIRKSRNGMNMQLRMDWN